MVNKEIWKDVINEEYYQVSNFGRVRTLDRTSHNRFYKGKIRKLTEDKDGYLVVSITRDNKVKTYKVHRLVTTAFLDKSKSKNFVNHIDGNKKNNHIENLEWCSHKENIIHAFGKDLASNRGSKNPKTKLKEDDVLNIREMHKNGFSYKDIAEKFFISTNSISKIINRKTWKHI